MASVKNGVAAEWVVSELLRNVPISSVCTTAEEHSQQVAAVYTTGGGGNFPDGFTGERKRKRKKAASLLSCPGEKEKKVQSELH